MPNRFHKILHCIENTHFLIVLNGNPEIQQPKGKFSLLKHLKIFSPKTNSSSFIF